MEIYTKLEKLLNFFKFACETSFLATLLPLWILSRASWSGTLDDNWLMKESSRALTVDITGVRDLVYNFILVSLKIRISNTASWFFPLSFKNTTDIGTSSKNRLSRFHGVFSIKNTILQDFRKSLKYFRTGVFQTLPLFQWWFEFEMGFEPSQHRP